MDARGLRVTSKEPTLKPACDYTDRREFVVAVLVAALLVLVPARWGVAQEEQTGSDTVTAADQLADFSVLQTGRIHSFVQDDTRIFLFLDGVHIAWGEVRLWAENVVVWCDRSETDPRRMLGSEEGGGGDDFRFEPALPPRGLASDQETMRPIDRQRPPAAAASDDRRQPPPPVTVPFLREIYAEGNVRIVWTADETMAGSALYFHMKENRGIVMDAALHSTLPIGERQHPLLLRADIIRQVCAEYATAENVLVSTCTYGEPHYHVRAERLELRGRVASGELDVARPAFVARGVPLPLPGMTFALGEDWPLPLKRVVLDQSSKFGVSLRTLWGRDIDELGRSVHERFGLDKPFRGSWFLDLDIYGRRGLGVGPGLRYKAPGAYRGYLRSYYIADKASEDHRTGPIENEDRGWIQTRNRIELPEFWLLDLELSYISEKSFLLEYFEEELKEDKEQETLAYLHRARDSNFLTLLSKFRINDFQTEIERAPEAHWGLTQIPLLDRGGRPSSDNTLRFHDLYYRHQITLSQLRYRPSDQLPDRGDLPTDPLSRADYLGALEAPISVGFLKFVPFLEQRASFYEMTRVDEHNDTRYITGAGLTASFLISRVSETKNDFFNIDGLRHVLEPTVGYRNNFEVNLEPQDLYRYDEIDDATDTEIIDIGLRHRMQTRDGHGGATTFFEGFYSLPVFPDKQKNPTGKRLGNARFDLYWNPDISMPYLKNIFVNEQGELNIHEEDLERLKSHLVLKPESDFYLRASHSWIRNLHSFVTVGIGCVLTPRWELDFETRRDLELREWMRQAIVLRRRAHQWIFEFEVELDRSDHERSISLSVMPLSLMADRESSSFYDPLRGN